MRLLGRIIMVPLGVIIAALAAIVFAGIAMLTTPLAGALLAAAFKSILGELFNIAQAPSRLAELDPERVFRAARALVAAIFFPQIITGLACEFFAIRSGLAQIFACAAIAALIPALMLGASLGAGIVPAAGFFAAMGACAGAVYWLIAGRRAGKAVETPKA